MPSPRTQILFRLTRSAALLVALLLIGIAMIQDRLLYFPEAASVDETLRATGQANALPWPARDNFRGVLAEPAAPTPTQGTVLIFHGNAGHAGHRGEYIERLNPLGLRVILAEYPAYGARAGALGEASLVADAVDTFMLAQQQFGGPIYLAGESLGAGVVSAATAALTTRGETVAGLLLITPWDRLQRVASYHYPWLPVRWLLRDRYASIDHLQDYTGPAVVVLADDDHIVPAKFGQALFDGFAGRKHRVRVPGAGHNDWASQVDASWWRDLAVALQDKAER